MSAPIVAQMPAHRLKVGNSQIPQTILGAANLPFALQPLGWLALASRAATARLGLPVEMTGLLMITYY